MTPEVIIAIITVIVGPIIGVIVWAVKSYLTSYQRSQDAWLSQTAEITTAFVEHTVKQSVMMEAVKLNLEQLNQAVIEQQKQQTDAVLKTLDHMGETLKKHQEETERITSKQSEVLSSICIHIENADTKFKNISNSNHEDILVNTHDIKDLQTR
jgi:hypothetical protein